MARPESSLKKIFKLLDGQEKLQLYAFLVMMLVGAGLEVLGVSLIFPFIQLINDPGIIHRNRWIAPVYDGLHFTSAKGFLIFIGFALIFTYLLKNTYFMFFYHFQNRFLAKKKLALSKTLLEVYLKAPYVFHLQRNSSELMNNLSAALRLVDAVFFPSMIIITELIVLTVVLSFILVVQPLATLAAIIILGSSTWFMFRFVQKRIKNYANLQHFHGSLTGKWLNQSFGGIKETKILGREKFFIDHYGEHFSAQCTLSQYSNTVTQLPRLVIETVLVSSVIIFIVLSLIAGKDTQALLPILGLFAVSALRLMPSISRIVLSAIQLREGKTFVELSNQSFKEVRELTQAFESVSLLKSNQDFSFNQKMELRDVSYSYPNTIRPAVSNLSLTLEKGQTIAFVGRSGAGKTTLVDTILGLLKPQSGQILIDGMDLFENLSAWQKTVGYIPQQIFLCDDTIRANVAFGIHENLLNEEAVWKALQLAQLDDFIRSLPEGLDTMVGERGVRLSGGQRQRIGIARSLYHDPSLLILDEATSALDNETEAAVASSIESLSHKKTMIIIAHRLSTVARCDRLYFMQDGKIIDSGTYDELLQSNRDFSKLARAKEQTLNT